MFIKSIMDNNKSKIRLIFDKIEDDIRYVQGMKKINYLDSFTNDVAKNYNGDIKQGILAIKDRQMFVQLIREIKEKYLAKHLSTYDTLFRLCDIIFIFTAFGIQIVEYYYDRHYDKETNNLITTEKSTRDKLLAKLSILDKQKKKTYFVLMMSRIALVVLICIMWYLFKIKKHEYEYCSKWRYSTLMMVFNIAVLLNLVFSDVIKYKRI